MVSTCSSTGMVLMRKRWMAALAALGLLIPLSGNATAAPPDRIDQVESGRPAGTPPADNRIEVFADGTTVSEPITSAPRDTRAATTPVTIDFTWLDGSVAGVANVWWLNLDTGNQQYEPAYDGTAVINLEPGDYGLMLDMRRYPTAQEPMSSVTTVVDLTVTDEPAALTVDGTKAKPVVAAVDRAGAVTQWRQVQFYANGYNGFRGGTIEYVFSGAEHVYAIPSPKLFLGHNAGMAQRVELTNPPGAADPYSYNLFDLADRGIPADPALRVHDTNLAVRHATYRGLGGTPVQVTRKSVAFHADRLPYGFPPGSPVTVPGSRTEYYTADPSLTWSHVAAFGGGGGPLDHAMHSGGVLRIGERNEVWFSAPLSVRVPDTQFPYHNPGVQRWAIPQGGVGSAELHAQMPLFSSGSPDEVIGSYGLPGTSTISKDGVVLATAPNGSMVNAALPDDDAGRFTVTMDATRHVPWTPFGTRSTAKWEFDSASVPVQTPVGVSAVRLDSPDVVDGYAKRDRPQRVTLEFETQNGVPDRRCAGMTFEVSYDDGASWSTVDIARHGDHATAKLRHPAGAEFVSVRFTAVDDLGQTVATSTIRSYGLR